MPRTDLDEAIKRLAEGLEMLANAVNAAREPLEKQVLANRDARHFVEWGRSSDATGKDAIELGGAASAILQDLAKPKSERVPVLLLDPLATALEDGASVARQLLGLATSVGLPNELR